METWKWSYFKNEPGWVGQFVQGHLAVPVGGVGTGIRTQISNSRVSALGGSGEKLN